LLLTWFDNSGVETGFAIERCTGAGCVNFVQIATVGPLAGIGSVSYLDITVAPNTTYRYRVAAMNAAGLSDYSNIVTMQARNFPLAPSTVWAEAFRSGNKARITVHWTDNSSNETRFVVQWSLDPNFTTIAGSRNAPANSTSLNITNLSLNTNYYVRVQAFNGSGGSFWVNAIPFPIHTPQ
jgi:hypothetical protein